MSFYLNSLIHFKPEPESEPVPEVFAVPTAEVSEEAIDQSNGKRSEAMEALSDGRFEDAITSFTEAIKLNPGLYSC